MKKFKFGFLIAMLLGVSTVFAQTPPEINPINILNPPVATDCGIYDVDLVVQQYIDVANISMTLDLNNLAAAYTGLTWNTTAWPALAGAFVYVNPAGQLKISWTSDPDPLDAMTLADNTVLFTLHFDVNGLWGTSHDLAWDDVLTIDCELSGPNGYPIYPDYWNDLHWDIQDQLEITGADITPYACPDNPMGAIDLHVAGGVPPYTYAWTGPNGFTATTEDLTGLFAGVYCVTVTDADFCEVNECFTVTEEIIPPPVIPIPNGSLTVECLDAATSPTPPIVYDYCGTQLTPVEDTIDTPDPIVCEGERIYRFTYTDYQNNSVEWLFTYTIAHSTNPTQFTFPSDASTVACIANATEPATLPVVKDVCGVVLTNPTYTNGGTYVDCEGTYTYVYTWTDCALLTYEWTYTYTIEVEDFTMPADDGETITCETGLYEPTPPAVNDYCGNPITPTGPVVSTTPPCNGTVTYVWNYEDCEGNNHDWTYTFTINDDIDPTITCPPDITVYMDDGCTWLLDEVVLGDPVVNDNCTAVVDLFVSNNAPTNFPAGTTTVTWTVEDCVGNSATCDQLVTVLYNALSGSLVYNNIEPFHPDKILNNVEIKLFDDIGLTNEVGSYTTGFSGNYSFPGLCAGDYYLQVQPHNKPPGGVNTTDVGQIIVYYNNVPSIESVRWLAGNTDNAGIINVIDAGKAVLHFLDPIANPFDNYWNYYLAGDLALTNSAPAMPMSVYVGGGNLAGQKIYGQCTGDFNGNFAPGIMKSASESLTLEYRENMLVSSDTEFELPVYAATDMEVGAVSLIMNFPADEVEITNVFFTSDPSSSLQYNVKGDELRISWYSLAPVWLNKGESLVTLQMKLKTEVAEEIQISLASNELNELADGNFDVIGNASLLIDIPSTTALGIGVNLSAEEVDFISYPNPFKGTTTLTYSLPVDGQVIIEVYDLLGSKVKVAVDEPQSAGEYSLTLDASNLQPGIYTAILKLKSSDAKIITRAIKMINR